ncbi:MAG: inositol monophosphatase family protein [Candidatus Paceibacterota bacterium]|jgi:fructose-1,6-bisphosphatase/inositol monophosphatase family enzyme
MTNCNQLGELTPSGAGIIMKEMVRRAIVTIRNQRQVFEVQTKVGHSGRLDDILTSADKLAQLIYLRSIQECFPGFGVIAEEDGLRILPSSCVAKLAFTVDPLDGTKAFVRRQSHGVGTMISLFCDDGFLAAYVGDINTQEIYGFRPGSQNVHRIDEFTNNETLTIQPKPLKKQYVMLRDPEVAYGSVLTRRLINSGFKSQIIDGGSIGIWLARLWKGEVGAALVPSGVETPWDANPVNAISQALGFVHIKPCPDNLSWEICPIQPITKTQRREHDLVIVHQSNVDEVMSVSL